MILIFSGGSLDRYGKIPEPVLGRIAVAVVKGLQYLWSLKIMHRGLYEQKFELVAHVNALQCVKKISDTTINF